MTDYRKLIKFGTNSAIISLPKRWLTKNKLVPGDTIKITQLPGELIVAPGHAATSKKQKDYFFAIDGDDTTIIKRKILHAYLNNCDTLTFKGDVASKSKEIRHMVHQLMALEIIEESPRKLQAKCYLNMHDINLANLVRKIDANIKSMFPDTISKTEHPGKDGGLDLAKNLSRRDEDVNRLSYLIMRSVKYLLEHPNEHTLTSTELLNYWDLAHTLERVGDQLKRLSRLLGNLDEAMTKTITPLLRSLSPLLQSLATHYDEIMKAYYKEDNAALHKLATKRQRYIERFDTYQQQQERSAISEKAINLARVLFHRIDELTTILKEEQHI